MKHGETQAELRPRAPRTFFRPRWSLRFMLLLIAAFGIWLSSIASLDDESYGHVVYRGWVSRRALHNLERNLHEFVAVQGYQSVPEAEQPAKFAEIRKGSNPLVSTLLGYKGSMHSGHPFVMRVDVLRHQGNPGYELVSVDLVYPQKRYETWLFGSSYKSAWAQREVDKIKELMKPYE